MLIILALGCGFLFGVGMESLGNWPFSGAVFFVVLVLGLFKRSVSLFIVVCALFGIFRTQMYEEKLQSTLSPGFQTIEGVISAELDKREGFQNVTVKTVGGDVLAQVSIYEALAYGDRLTIQGDMELVSALENRSYAAYLSRYGVVALLWEARVLESDSGQRSLFGSLYEFKSIIETRLQKILPEPEASFAAGLLLGSRKGMPEFLTEAFRTVGLLHIVAISGANISLVIALVFVLLSFLPLKSRVIASALVIFIFMILVGASSTVIRASVMGVLTLWGLYFGRKSTALFGLFWSLIFLVLWNPYLLLFDVGFQLSVLSTFGLLVFVPVLERGFKWAVPDWAASFKEAFLLTLAAQLTTLPLMLYHFGQLSWVTPFANVLVAPFLPLAMLCSFLGLLIPWFSAPAWVALFIIERVALIGAALPGAAFTIEISLPEMVTLYVLEVVFLLLFYRSILVRAFLRDSVPNTCEPSSLEFQKHEKPAERPA